MPINIATIRYVVVIFLLLLVLSARNASALALSPGNNSTINPSATQYASYTATTRIQATGAMTLPLTWSATLPQGLSWSLSTTNRTNDTFTITGLPTVSGANLTFTVTVTDSRVWPSKRTDTNTFRITINPSCRLSGAIQGLYFGVLNAGNGDIDPSTSPPFTSTVTNPVTFQCGGGNGLNLSYALSVLSPSPPLQMNVGANAINFTVGFTADGNGSDGMPLTPLIPNNASTIDNFSGNFNAGTSSISGSIIIRLSWNAGANYLDSTLNVLPVNIVKTCATPINGHITFNINPVTSPDPLTVNTTIDGASPTVMCTNGTTYSVTCLSSDLLSTGYLRKGGAGGTDPIAYTITSCPTPVSGHGFSSTATPIDIGISLNKTGAYGYQDALQGAHSDTITVQVSY